VNVESEATGTEVTSCDVYSRRVFIGRGAGVAAGILAAPVVAACGSSSGETASGGTASASAVKGTVGGTVNYYGYQGNDALQAMKSWNAEHHVTFRSNYIATHEDLAAKFASGAAAGTDVVNWDYQVEAMYAATGKIFQPMDASLLPNMKNLDPAFPPARLNNGLIGVPLDFGTIGITYDSARIPEPTAWADLLQPKFKGQISMVNDPASGVNLAANILKLNTPHMTTAQLNQVGEYLKRMREQCRTVAASWGDMTTLLVQGEIVACYDGWVSMNGFAAQAGKKTVKTNFTPKEGSWSYVDMFCVPQGANNPVTAYAWLDEMLTPQGNAAYQNQNLQGSPVRGAEQYLSTAARDLYPYNDLKSLLAAAPFTLAPPTKAPPGYVTYADAVAVFNHAVNGT
jgi:spermidine/putrescine-binding protein